MLGDINEKQHLPPPSPPPPSLFANWSHFITTFFLTQCFLDDYWKKFFLADDIAMLLTDVARSVSNVENFLQKENGGRRISRSSFKRSSVGSPPPILEVSCLSPLVTSHKQDLCWCIGGMSANKILKVL